MTDVEIIMDAYDCDAVKAQSRLSRGVSDRVVKAYRAGYEKAYQEAIDADLSSQTWGQGRGSWYD